MALKYQIVFVNEAMQKRFIIQTDKNVNANAVSCEKWSTEIRINICYKKLFTEKYRNY